MRLTRFQWLFVLVLVLPCLVGAQTVNKTIETLNSGHKLGRIAQLAVSPSGGSIAITDQHANLIFITDPEGDVLWIVGEGLQIRQPEAVCFVTEERVLFSQKNSLVIFGANRKDPARLDTVADLTEKLPAKASIDQLVSLSSGGYLILDHSLAAVYRLKGNWDFDKILISRGDRKGQLWSPAGMAIDLAGNIVVADAGSYPIQTFSRDGRFLFQGSWNAPERARSWTAGALAISRDDRIWVADVAGAQWRVFDRTGNEIAQSAFSPPIFRPNTMIALTDNRLLVGDERGILIYLKTE
jgi:DNA-binding beta-propeller fold protein YncE